MVKRKISKINVSTFNRELKRTNEIAKYCRILYRKQSTIFRLDIHKNPIDFQKSNDKEIEKFIEEVVRVESEINDDFILKGINHKINLLLQGVPDKLAEQIKINVDKLAQGNIYYDEYIRLYINNEWEKELQKLLEQNQKDIEEFKTDLFLYNQLPGDLGRYSQIIGYAYVLDSQFQGDYRYEDIRTELEFLLVLLESILFLITTNKIVRSTTFDFLNDSSYKPLLRQAIHYKLEKTDGGFIGFTYKLDEPVDKYLNRLMTTIRKAQ